MPIYDTQEDDKKVVSNYYDVKVGVAYIKTPYFETPDRIKFEEDAVGNRIQYILHDKKWREVIKISEKNERKEYYIKVPKEEYPNAIPAYRPYFTLPPEMDKFLSKRALIIPNCYFVSIEIDEIIDANHMKFENKQLACFGNGKKAQRYDPLAKNGKGGWVEVDCKCAYSKYYASDNDTEIPNEVAPESDMIKAKRTITRQNKDVEQYLIQGAWRDVVKKLDNKVILKPLSPSCDVRFSVYALYPKIKGLKLIRIQGNGRHYYEKLRRELKEIKKFLKGAGLDIMGQPMQFKVTMEKKDKKGKGVYKYARLSIEFTKSLDQLMEAQSQKKILIASGGAVAEDEEMDLEQQENQTIEDADFESVSEGSEDESLDDDGGEEEEENLEEDSEGEEEPPEEGEQISIQEETKSEVSKLSPNLLETFSKELQEYISIYDERFGRDTAYTAIKDAGIDPVEKNDEAIKILKKRLVTQT